MHHVAILNKQNQWLRKILAGEKTIESRWYQTKRAPWNNIKAGEIVYFKNSGEPISAKAEIEKVLLFNHPTEQEIHNLLKNYAKAICIDETYKKEYQKYNYIILIFLKNPQSIKPFHINKHGYGNMTAWITVEDIKDIKKKANQNRPHQVFSKFS